MPGSLEDAEFILRACNSHYELVEALKEVDENISGFIRSDLNEAEQSTVAWIQKLVRAALARATGKEDI